MKKTKVIDGFNLIDFIKIKLAIKKIKFQPLNCTKV